MKVEPTDYANLVKWAGDMDWPQLRYQMAATVGPGFRAWGSFFALASDAEVAAAIVAVRAKQMED